jgi:epoxyqueuosine reductase
LDMKKNIKEVALGHGMDLCGIASVDRFQESPQGRHPCDILPGCKSVIVIGVRLLDGAVQANFRAFEDGRRDLKGLYGTYGYAMLPNFALTYACYAVAQFIERNTGACSTPCSTGPMTNGAQLSLRHAAVAAGLGEFSWSGLIVTPEFGPRIRFGVILTTLKLEPDPLYTGKQLCNPEKCGICASVCPTAALSKYGEAEPYIANPGGKHSEYCRISWPKCQMAIHAMTKKLGGSEDYITTSDPTPQDILDAQSKMPILESGLQHHTSHNCGKCLSYCPVGNWGHRFKKTGISKGVSGL